MLTCIWGGERYAWGSPAIVALIAAAVLLGGALIVAVLYNFVNVVGRYVFGETFISADEVQIYIMVYIAFLGAAVATWRRVHLRMDVLVQRLPRAAKATLAALELALVLVLRCSCCTSRAAT
jgi:TRAP-type C4-dicarboxylate transport system permease small subunit